ncbi:MAG: hypothetical protein HYZ27_05125, partial [Deltaproteobacteria bacterium]|nr:hypothetical protein [Deltaproteobacteria bacterium]
MKTTAIQLRGNAGAGDLRTTTAAQVRERVLEFLNARRPAGANLQLAIDPTALALTREYNGTWTLRFA